MNNGVYGVTVAEGLSSFQSTTFPFNALCVGGLSQMLLLHFIGCVIGVSIPAQGSNCLVSELRGYIPAFSITG